MPSLPPEQCIVTTRIVDAPAELVFRAFTEPDRLARWWGPSGFRTTTAEMDLRAGGRWRFTMHGPDGTDYENEIHYLAVEPPRLLRYRHTGVAGTEPVDFTTTVTCEPLPGPRPRTQVTLRAEFPSAAARDRVARDYGAVEGAEQCLGRLADHVTTTTDPHTFVLQRVVKAPPARVWQAWTDRDQLPQWFGPKGSTMPTCTLELRPGGCFHYALRMPNGMELWGKWLFTEVTPPTRLRFLSAFADADGAIASSPFPGPWPRLTATTVTFEPHAGLGGGTVVTLQATPHEATEAERKAFLDGHASLRMGWGGTFEQLLAFLGSD